MIPRIYRGEIDYKDVLAFVQGKEKWGNLPPYWNGGKTQQGIYITLYEGDPEDHIFWLDESDQLGAYLWLSPKGQTATYYDFSDMKWQLTVHPSFLSKNILRQIISYAETQLHQRAQNLPIRTYAYSSDFLRIQMLEEFGYQREKVADIYMQRSLNEDIAEIQLLDGYRIAVTVDERYLYSRELVAAGAFAGSEEGSEWGHNNVRRLWRFDGDGDHLHAVVLSPDDEVVSFVHATFDKVTGLGELALVATHPRHYRKGFSKALCLYSIKAMQAYGLQTAVVRTQIDNFAAQITYRAAGFESSDVLVSFINGHLE